jgi:hypothetical protein
MPRTRRPARVQPTMAPVPNFGPNFAAGAEVAEAVDVGAGDEDEGKEGEITGMKEFHFFGMSIREVLTLLQW